MGKIVVSENVTLDGVTQALAGDEGFRGGGWAGLIGNSPQLAKLALDEALAAGPSFWVGEATSGSPRGGHLAAASWRTGCSSTSCPRPRQSRLEQLDSPQGRRA
jgi:hypothetical protein